MIVASVLKSGGAYGPDDVDRLYCGVGENLRGHDFVCLSDQKWNAPYTIIPLTMGWPGWWSKTELFRPGLFPDGERILYIDLAAVIVGELTDLAGCDVPFAMLSDWHTRYKVASGVMSWETGRDEDQVFARFLMDPVGIMAQHPLRMDTWLHEQVGKTAHRLQHLYPDQIVSFKEHCERKVPRGASKVPPNARIVTFHGWPKPADLEESHPLRRKWEGR